MQGVVFDFDGVIAQSMEMHAEAYRQLLAPLGIAVPFREVFLNEGARSETIIRDFLGPNTDHDLQALANRKQEIFAELGSPHCYPGARELLADIQKLVPTGLVTGTRRSNLDRLVPDLVPSFKAIMTQESYTHDKPHPEPYATAAQAMGIDPQSLICVENAIRGVQSARAAGYGHTVAITTTLSEGDLHEADSIVPNHAELATKLLELLQ